MDILGFFSIPNWLVYLLLFLIGNYIYLTWHYGYFKARGIPGPKPVILLGNMDKVNSVGMPTLVRQWVKEYGNVVGFFELRQPQYLIADVKILKQIFVKEFSSFSNRRTVPFMKDSKILTFLRGDDWRRVRNHLTPTFTSGKMRQMTTTISSVTDELIDKINEAAENGTILEMKSTSRSYVLDVIAAVAFGIKTNCQKSNADPFLRQATVISKAITNSPWMLVFVFLPQLVPVFEYLGASLFPRSSVKFFRDVFNSTMNLRRQDPDKDLKNDFLQIMMDANSSQLGDEAKKDLAGGGLSEERVLKGLTDEEMFHQSMAFFIAGNDTTAATMGFLFYHLATEPGIQDKVYEEVDELVKTNSILTYDIVQKMTYLDMCVNETLRLYPPAAILDREVDRDITIEGFHFEKGILVHAAVAVLHRDEEVWPEPDKFRPERFSAEAVAARNPFYFMPFGHGPRNCIGMRFAQMEMKMAIGKLVHRFRIVPCEETDIPLVLNTSIIQEAKNGIKVKFEKR